MSVCAGAPAQADPAPFGVNDAGGFRNVLPPGEAGVDNAAQLGVFRATGQRPAHWDDQQPLYDNLLYASPGLTHDQIPSYYKDATFGVRAGDVASTESPRPGVTIVRDRSYGIPHIYGRTNDDVLFGEGYAGAEDRLFLIDVLRHTGRGELSSFAGGSAGNREMDRTQWAIAPYTEADLQSQIDNAPRLYGALGTQLVDYLSNFVAGINAYIDAATLNPNLMPAEYAAFGKTPQHFTGTDVIAEASLIGGIFGKGGGRALDSALTLQAFQRRFGQENGKTVWSDFRSRNDPEAPLTTSQSFPFATSSPFSPRGLALPDPGSVRMTPTGPPLTGAGASAHLRGGPTVAPPVPRDGSVGSQLLHMFRQHPSMSNWELVAARHSSNGHAIAVMGPQVGYYVPQILLEQDVHGPNFDARGAAFPGVNVAVQLGHGRDYAWSATTANSQNVDTFAEVLCQDDFHYLYRDQCLAMDRLDRSNRWTPNASDQTPPGSETLTAYRTVHGIVEGRGTVGGRKVAFVLSRTTYFHEADSAVGFFEFNDPSFVRGPASFQKAASDINFGFNWSYADADHIAYYHSGWYPQRADGTSSDFPVLGTGQYDWKGYDPTLHTLSLLPFAQHPNAVDPDYLVSWNNKQAPNWSAADDKYTYGAVHRSAMIERRIRDAISQGRKIDTARLVQAMDEPATEDIRMVFLWPILRQVLGQPADPALGHAIALLDQWYAAGGHRRDLQRRGTYDNNAAVTIMDAWWPLLLGAEFRPALGDDAFNSLASMAPLGAPNPGADPAAPDFENGWYGYVSKDLRDLLAVAGPAAGARPSTCRRAGRRARRRARGRRHRHLHRQKVRACAPAGRHRHRRHRGRHASAASHRRHRHHHRVRVPGATQTPSAAATVPGAYSRVFCGNGSLEACRSALLQSLGAALRVSPQTIYGHGACVSDPQAECFDKNRSVIASGISVGPAPFQNRPTFQQVVELTQRLPR